MDTTIKLDDILKFCNNNYLISTENTQHYRPVNYDESLTLNLHCNGNCNGNGNGNGNGNDYDCLL